VLVVYRFGGIAAEDDRVYDEEANNSKHAVVSYLQGLQKDMGAESAPWSSSILRAASFLCEKIDRIGQNANTVFPTSGSVTNLATLGGNGNSGGSTNSYRSSRYQRGTLHKANSIGGKIAASSTNRAHRRINRRIVFSFRLHAARLLTDACA
jgi:hypothetical protein